MSGAEAVLETGSSVASEGDEAESRPETDSDMDDVDLTENDSSRHKPAVIKRNNVPKLNLATIPPMPNNRPAQPVSHSYRTQRSDTTNPVLSTRVDLLSQAFRIKPELIKQATENGKSLEEIIANGFQKALDVQQDRLKFYIVEELNSLDKAKTEGKNKHIAVAVNSSSFSLNSLESLVEQNKQAKLTVDNCNERLQISEERTSVLEYQLAHVKEQLKKFEDENKRLVREIELLRSNLSRQQSTPSPVSDPLISPRLLTHGGQQSRLSSRMIHLQQLVTDNQQLISDLSRRVRTQTEIESLLR